MLEIKDLSVQYGKQAPTIEHFNLSMKKGEIISVVGESGSGKNNRDPCCPRRTCRRWPGQHRRYSVSRTFSAFQYKG